MGIRTLGLFLIGNRQAILDLAADRRALWVGALFVLSAGLAREYDGEDLLRKPWFLIIPLGASLAASFLLFVVACSPVFRRAGRPPFLTAYRSFLTLFWMTAPLAWLYAIPYERFLSLLDATLANLWTLAIVAGWRVALMVRVVSVITSRSATSSFFLVMAFADAVALVTIESMPKPIISFMGGVRLTESEALIANATCNVCLLGYLTAPLWVIGALIAFASGKPSWQVPTSTPASVNNGRGLWLLAAIAILIWIPILPFTQSELRLSSRVEENMKAGHIDAALDLMFSHSRSDFPPSWDPPPRIGYGETTPRLIEVMEVLVDRQEAPWVRTVYAEKFDRELGEGYSLFYSAGNLEQLLRISRILRRLPEGPAIVARHRASIDSRLRSESVSAEEREALESLLALTRQNEKPGR
jgi:hypothetical protein